MQYWNINISQITGPLEQQAECINAWWDYTGRPHPGIQEINNSLKRLVSDVMTHPMTIGKVIAEFCPKRKKGYPKSIHLVGTGTIEVSYSVKRNIDVITILEKIQFQYFNLFGSEKISYVSLNLINNDIFQILG